jgi:hypothetical protein
VRIRQERQDQRGKEVQEKKCRKRSAGKEAGKRRKKTKTKEDSCLQFNPCKKFPPNTRESSGVNTACIHPVGMKNVCP